MATRHQTMQRMIRQYRQRTGKLEVDMHEVARFAAEMGFPVPAPIDPIDRLAREFSQAAREEIRHDKKTKRPYRANHAYSIPSGTGQLNLWIDIDEAPRAPILKSLVKQREQTIGDMLQLTFDAEHWNNIHQDEEPIVIECDLAPDVEWRKNYPDEEDRAS